MLKGSEYHKKHADFFDFISTHKKNLKMRAYDFHIVTQARMRSQLDFEYSRNC